MSGYAIYSNSSTINLIIANVTLPSSNGDSITIRNMSWSLFNETSAIIEFFAYLDINESSHGLGVFFTIEYRSPGSSVSYIASSTESFLDFYDACSSMPKTANLK